MVQLDRNAVITLQGGGLYGLTLLGQLSATIQEVDVVAIAGTSAGAIIAALFWAGWTPRDLRDRLGAQARYRRLHALLGDFEPPEDPFDFGRWSGLTKDISAAFASMRSRQPGGIGGLVRYLPMLYELRRLFSEIAPHYRSRGVFRGTLFEDFVDELLREGVRSRGYNGDLPDRPLTFEDFEEVQARSELYFPPLVLAATNVGTQDVELINSLDARYRDVTIARAVRASAGYPGFFRPVHLSGLPEPAWFIDGGVISNFPAWAFSDQFREKMHNNQRYRALAYRPWVHVGLRLVEKDTLNDTTGERLPLFDYEELERPSSYMSALRRLMLGEARNRLEDMISGSLARSIIIPQPYEESGGPSNMLDLDAMNERRVHNMFNAGRCFARRELNQRSFLVRAEAADVIQNLMTKLIQNIERILDPGRRQTALRIRSNIFLPSTRWLRMRFRVNMADPQTGNDDPDVAMEFDRPDQGLTGLCFSFRRPLICNLELIGKYVQQAGTTLFKMTSAQQALVLRDRTWLASTPIFDPNDVAYRKSLLPDIEPAPELFATQLGVVVDGPVFGVLNIDANLDYTVAGLNVDPNIHAEDPRIAAILDMMSVSAARIGQILGREFAATTEGEGHD